MQIADFKNRYTRRIPSMEGSVPPGECICYHLITSHFSTVVIHLKDVNASPQMFYTDFGSNETRKDDATVLFFFKRRCFVFGQIVEIANVSEISQHFSKDPKSFTVSAVIMLLLTIFHQLKTTRKYVCYMSAFVSFFPNTEKPKTTTAFVKYFQ